MFGFAKRLVKQAEGIIAPEVETNEPKYGFRILNVDADSPADEAGLESLFDFVIAVNGQRFDNEVNEYSHASIYADRDRSPVFEFEAAVSDSNGRLILQVWSAKGREERQVILSYNPSQGIGASLQWTPLTVSEHVWHILHVDPLSPAEQAGLRSHSDYIVAAENGLLEEGGEYLIGKVISQANTTDGVLFYVYNRDFDIVRPVRIFPSAEGRLGCGVGYGLLHALPSVQRQTKRSGLGTIFDEKDSQQFEPTLNASNSDEDGASKQQVTPPPATLPTYVRTRAKHHDHSNSKPRNGHGLSGLDDYFSEQSEISKSIDGSESRTKENAIPPPPKTN
ncbi:Grh1 protein [Starmerella bacillaris]|uniref:Grh1 protein n=1 Tax=Starmerella bacillaris TaxID=1247836 RepID=A0AAV5RIP4_STABA|nr:Grh1 protein [Starmerella bacillaris]